MATTAESIWPSAQWIHTAIEIITTKLETTEVHTTEEVEEYNLLLTRARSLSIQLLELFAELRGLCLLAPKYPNGPQKLDDFVRSGNWQKACHELAIVQHRCVEVHDATGASDAEGEPIVPRMHLPENNVEALSRFVAELDSTNVFVKWCTNMVMIPRKQETDKTDLCLGCTIL
jgi:hypothetical protein